MYDSLHFRDMFLRKAILEPRTSVQTRQHRILIKEHDIDGMSPASKLHGIYFAIA